MKKNAKRTATIGAKVTPECKAEIQRLMQRLHRDVSSGVLEAVMHFKPIWQKRADNLDAGRVP